MALELSINQSTKLDLKKARQAQGPQSQLSKIREAEAQQAKSLGNLENLSVQTPEVSSSRSDATRVSLSAGERAENSARQKISDASSVVSIAGSAVTEVENILGEVLSLAEEIKNEVNPSRQDELAQEAVAKLQEIDNIASSATFNDSSVIDAGKQDFSVSLEGIDSDSTKISVSNINATREGLGVDNISAQSFVDDNEGTQNTIKAARSQVNELQLSLSDSNAQVESAAVESGITGETKESPEAQQRLELAQAGGAEDLAGRIASSANEIQNSSRLDPIRVEDLIVSGSQDATQSSETPSLEPSAEEEEQQVQEDTTR